MHPYSSIPILVLRAITMRRSLPLFIGLVLSTAFSLAPAAEPSNRSTTPDYPIPYSKPKVDGIAHVLSAVKSQIEASAFKSLTTRPSANSSDASAGRRFALVTYPMGVIYSGMLAAADATGDSSFADFDAAHFQMFADE